MKNKKIAGVAALAVAGLLLSACAAETPAPDPTDNTTQPIEKISVTLALTSPTWSAGYAPFAVAEANGYFEAAGVDVNIVLTEGGTAAATQVAQGAADIGTVSAEPIMVGEANDRGLDLTSFYNLYRKSIFSVKAPASSGINSIADLRGKRVGVPSLAAVGVNILVANLGIEGLTANDVTMIEIGAGPQAVAAVESGAVDAVASDDVMFAQLENAGIPLVDLTSSDTSNLISNGLVARTADLEANPEGYARVGKAIAQGTLFTITNPEAAIHILWDSYPETKPSGVSDEEAMKLALNVLNSRILKLKLDAGDQWGEFPADAWSNAVNFALSTGLITNEIDPNSLFSTALVAQFNDFDAAAIEAEARAAQ